MPRSSVLLTARPVSGDDVVAAAEAVWRRLADGEPDAQALSVRTLDDGAVIQVGAGDDLLVSVLRPRPVPRVDEIVRLLPGVDASALPVPVFWTEAYTPWSAGGLVGVAVLEGLADRLDGVVAHQG